MSKFTRAALSVRFLLVMALVASVLMVANPPSASAEWSPPSFERSMGGIGRPGVYAWGLAHNPVSDEIIVSDYLNFRVRRYSTDGRHLGDLPQQPGEPWSVATDPNSGDIYSMNNWDNKIERFDATGNHLATLSVSGGWNAWIDVDHRGWIWMVRGGPQASNYKLDYYDSDGVKLGQWSINPPAELEPTMFGIEVAGDGRVFLNDANNGLIHVYGADGVFESSFGEGYLSANDQRGLTLDEANGWLYVSDASANSVVKFTMDGDFVTSWGSMGEAPGLFNGPRQLSTDSEGDVWVADFGNHRFQEFSPTGTLLGTYPDPPQAPPAGHLAHAADSVVDPATGDVWVADTYNQRFHRLASDGSPLGVWGKRGGSDFGMNYPSTIGFDPDLRRVWVGMEEGRHIKVYDENSNYLFIIGDQTKTPESGGYLRNVTDIDFYDGKAFVSDEQYDKIKVIDADTGEELDEIDAYDGGGWSGNHGLAINQANGDLFIASYSLDVVSVFDQAGNLKYTFGSSGSGDGQFQSPRDVAIIDDVVYVSDASLSRIQAFELDGTYLGRWGGWGEGAYQFRNPMGLDTDADGLLYVTDVENGRITVFDPSTPKPAFTWGRPSVSLTAPTDGQIFSGDQLMIAGTVTDDDGLANVEISVQSLATGLWWNGRISSWQADRVPNIGLWTSSSAPATSAPFSWFFPAIQRGDDYLVEVVARDRHGTASSPTSSATVTIGDGETPDVEDPVVAVSSPASGEAFPSTTAVTVEGSASDDVAVDSVDVAIQDTLTSEWWNPDGTWGAFAWLSADLAAPGAAMSDWNYSWDPTASGEYAVHARAMDTVGKTIVGSPIAFSVVDGTDSEPPDATVDAPTANELLPLEAITVSGIATDNVIVGGVDIAVRNNASGDWLRPDGTWGAFAWNAADLDTPNSSSTGYSWSFTPTDEGAYGLSVRASDLVGNTDPTKPWVPFSVVAAGGDTNPPDASVTDPTAHATVPAGTVMVVGSASDDAGVANVDVAVKDRTTGNWLNTDGSWGTFSWHAAALDDPGSPTTGWTLDLADMQPGSFALLVRGTDTSGNVDPSKPWVPFTVG